jgi:hypothetical protein
MLAILKQSQRLPDTRYEETATSQTTAQAHHGGEEQMFGAKQQVPQGAKC